MSKHVVKTSTDKRYLVYDDGVIYDTKTGLEWYCGPDKDINYSEAEEWLRDLNRIPGRLRRLGKMAGVQIPCPSG